jgi:hypothetical protein
MQMGHITPEMNHNTNTPPPSQALLPKDNVIKPEQRRHWVHPSVRHRRLRPPSRLRSAQQPSSQNRLHPAAVAEVRRP